MNIVHVIAVFTWPIWALIGSVFVSQVAGLYNYVLSMQYQTYCIMVYSIREVRIGESDEKIKRLFDFLDQLMNYLVLLNCGDYVKIFIINQKDSQKKW